MSSGARTKRQQRSSSRARLPRGPHALTREEVDANQRQRLVVAMGELAGEKGYTATTVADVLARAGVSRKSFYEHFANKQECFFAAYDAIAQEGSDAIMGAYEAAETPTAGAALAIAELFERAIRNPRGVRVALIEANAAGQAGSERREQLLSRYEGLLRDVLSLPPGPWTVPSPVLRGIVGGLTGVLNSHVRVGRVEQLRGLAPDLVRWATSYHPAPASILRLVSEPAEAPARPRGLIGGRAPGTLAAGEAAIARSRRKRSRGPHPTISRSMVVHSQRERVLDAVANLVARKGYGALTVQGIAERAAVSLQAFYEHFSGKEDAFLVAYEIGHTKGLSIVRRAYAAQPDWRYGVRAGLAALLDFLASEPSFAHLALFDALTATPRTTERAYEGAAAYAELLIPGAERARRLVLSPTVTIEAIVGGLFELCCTYALRGHADRLPELLPRATYFALAPFIGPEQAGVVATGETGGA